MIGILSDSHDNLIALRKAIGLFKSIGCELLVHAGDFVAPFAARELEKAGCPVKAVFGNCDGEKKGLIKAIRPFGIIREAPFAFKHGAVRFLLTHLDNSTGTASDQGKYDIIVYGHTHRPEIQRAGKTLVVNPGEAGGWLSGKSTVALFDPETGQAEIVSL